MPTPQECSCNLCADRRAAGLTPLPMYPLFPDSVAHTAPGEAGLTPLPAEEAAEPEPIDWWTSHVRNSYMWLTASRDFVVHGATSVDGQPVVNPFNDPEHPRVQRATADHVIYDSPVTLRDSSEIIPPRYLAYIMGLPSEAAALYAVIEGLRSVSHRATASRLLAHYESLDDYCPGECCYVPPTNPTDDAEHSSWCECEECSPCECGDSDCAECWPDGYECGCYDYDCSHCYPDGHPNDCDCHQCMDRYNVDDDQDLYDPWAGRPDMPESPPGRCRIGVEVEFNAGSRYEIANAITRNGIACLEQGYTHAITRFWKMTEDSTVTGGECVSPILSGSDVDIEQVREVIRIIKAHGGSTARNVGLHVHVDITQFRTMQLKSLAWNLRLGQEFLASFVPEWRYDSSLEHGATLLSEYDWDAIDRWLDDIDPGDRCRTVENRERSCPIDRYTAFNFNSVLTYGTVEMRLLGHTLNTIKVRTWIRVLQAIVEASRKREVVDSGADVLTWLVEHGELEQEHADQFRSVAIARGNEHMLVAA